MRIATGALRPRNDIVLHENAWFWEEKIFRVGRGFQCSVAEREIFRRKMVNFNKLSLLYGRKYSIITISIVVSVPVQCKSGGP